jgi:thiol-disulfide isomerase/thioredoxin
MLQRAWLCVAFLIPSAFPECVADGAAKLALEEDSQMPAAGTAERVAALEKALRADPANYFLLDRLRSILDEDATRAALIERLAALQARYPESPAVAVVYAAALRTKDAAKALAILESVEKSHPEFPFSHLKLVPVFSWGKFQNKARLDKELDAFLNACPAPESGYAYRMVVSQGTQEQIARHAKLLRARLEADKAAGNQQLYSVLWDLEFKAVPPADHGAVRERIARDLARLETSPSRDKLDCLTLLRDGYRRMGDQAACDRIDERILKNHPGSTDAEAVVTGRWQKEHPFPENRDKAALQGWYRAQAAAAHEWREKWPTDNMLFGAEFTAVAALEDTKGEELQKLAEAYIAHYREHGDWWGALPMEFDVADALLRKKLTNPAIPDWIEEGYRREAKRSSAMLERERENLTEERRAMADVQMSKLRIARARILLDYYDAIGQPVKSRLIEDSISGENPPEMLKAALYEVRAKAAEMDKRKLDALVLYRAADDLQPGQEAAHKQELRAKMDRLWNELGGSASVRSIFAGSKLKEVNTMQWEKPKGALPAFSLPDLEGKTWKPTDFAGRATLINVWATWCGPCRAEHPAFQKLYDKLKDRKDVAVLSVSADDSVGLVAPYMKEHGYTFPVLVGLDLRDTAGIDPAIPQNWFVSPAGKLEVVQTGYDASPDWERAITGKIEELLKSK